MSFEFHSSWRKLILINHCSYLLKNWIHFESFQRWKCFVIISAICWKLKTLKFENIFRYFFLRFFIFILVYFQCPKLYNVFQYRIIEILNNRSGMLTYSWVIGYEYRLKLCKIFHMICLASFYNNFPGKSIIHVLIREMTGLVLSCRAQSKLYENFLIRNSLIDWQMNITCG